jgi:hypothetical protein
MLIRFRAYRNGELWCAQAEREDIFAIGESITDLMRNVDTAARVHFSGKTARREEIHIMVFNETGAGA